MVAQWATVRVGHITESSHLVSPWHDVAIASAGIVRAVLLLVDETIDVELHVR